MRPEQYREYETWDADSRMAFDELAATLEHVGGMQRADAVFHALALTRPTAQKMTPRVNRGSHADTVSPPRMETAAQWI